MGVFLDVLMDLGLFGLIGFVAGCIGTIVGAGGGFLVVPALMHLWPGRLPGELTAASLVVVFFNGLSALGFHLSQGKKGLIDLRMGSWLALAAVPGALQGVHLFKQASFAFFTGFFGLFLVLMGMFLTLKSFKDQHSNDTPLDPGLPSLREQPHRLGGARREKLRLGGLGAMVLAFVLSFLVAGLASGLGIGGGVFYVPTLVFAFSYPVHQAAATSQFIMTLMSAGAMITHVVHGHYERVPLGQLSWLVVGAVVGAQFGARVSPRLKGSYIVTGLAFMMVTIGIRLLVRAFSG